MPTLRKNKGTKREKSSPPLPDCKTLYSPSGNLGTDKSWEQLGLPLNAEEKCGILNSSCFSAPSPDETKVLLEGACFSFPIF